MMDSTLVQIINEMIRQQQQIQALEAENATLRQQLAAITKSTQEASA